jgi:glucose/arabinose dehydrogenase
MITRICARAFTGIMAFGLSGLLACAPTLQSTVVPQSTATARATETARPTTVPASTSTSVPPSPTIVQLPPTALPATATVPAVIAGASRALVERRVDVPAAWRQGRWADPRILRVPAGFAVGLYATGVPGARFMAETATGTILVTSISTGRVLSITDRDRDGVADRVDVWADGLQAPHGITIADGQVYVGETHRVVRFALGPDGERRGDAQVVVPDLPTRGGGHRTRTVGVGPDGNLYVSVGSSCNVCLEEDPRRAAMSVYRIDGSGGRVYYRGLRNAVGFVWRPGTAEIWATNNGRDQLGDDLPPETVYRLRDGGNAGWPTCNPPSTPDPQFGNPSSCAGVDPPTVSFQAHMAPLGLRFYDREQFPAAYRGDLFVAFHGSWNRSVPIGYKVQRVEINAGSPMASEDFITGWLPPSNQRGEVWGRPVDVLATRDGALLISDDDGGAIYRVTYAGV